MAEREDPLRPPEFWARLLKFVDAELEERHELDVVGGAAIGLRYSSKHLTTDIDSITPKRDRKLWAAVERAQKVMQEAEGLPKPPQVNSSRVFDPPEDWESRRRRVLPGLKKLVVRVPERHDLAISKVSRGLDRDFAALKAMHEETPLRLATLVDRFREALRVFVGDERKFTFNFLVLIEELFGAAEATRVERLLKRA